MNERRDFVKSGLFGITSIALLPGLSYSNDIGGKVDVEKDDYFEKEIRRRTILSQANVAFELASKNSDYVEKAQEIIEEAEAIDLAYNMAKKFGADPKWAERVIEKGYVNQENVYFWSQAGYAYFMVIDKISKREWAEKVIENENEPHIGVAYNMVEFCGSSKEWYKKVTGMDYENV